MNDDKIMQGGVNELALLFGFCPLHALMRCEEYVLNLSKRLGLQKWRTNAEDKPELDRKKKYIQERFLQEKGIFVDFPKQGGGNTNDGNSARVFFDDPNFTAEVTGVDVNVITGLKNLLIAIRSSTKIDPNKYDAYALKVRNLIKQKYSWYYLPATVHKVNHFQYFL